MSDTLTLDTVISGAEFRDFYHNRWPKTWYVEEFYLDAEDDQGNLILPDDGKYALKEFGWAGWQGPGTLDDERTSIPIGELYIRTMSPLQDTGVLSFRLPKAKYAQLRTFAEGLGATEV